ncbi:hypothetical protein ABZ568_00645 [Streptomyces olindensis]|uniref:Uncharacterized protein n=1 Tax=Streptomyces olindensis TaxID=358823 RepID=A0ABV2XLV2_9ACTN
MPALDLDTEDARLLLYLLESVTSGGALPDNSHERAEQMLQRVRTLPKTSSAAPAADDRPHGTPGEDAGTCGQCHRPLIWDSSGRRVNDEWGEYLCYGPRTGGTGSAVHVLAATAAQPQN